MLKGTTINPYDEWAHRTALSIFVKNYSMKKKQMVLHWAYISLLNGNWRMIKMKKKVALGVCYIFAALGTAIVASVFTAKAVWGI